MIRPQGVAVGFESHPMPVASTRLINAVAASLALGALSLCVIVALTAVSISASIGLPLPT